MRGEDERLAAMGLARKMPQGWEYGDDPHARYTEPGIQLSESFLRVKGKIKHSIINSPREHGSWQGYDFLQKLMILMDTVKAWQ